MCSACGLIIKDETSKVLWSICIFRLLVRNLLEERVTIRSAILSALSLNIDHSFQRVRYRLYVARQSERVSQ